jgi:hypothetical protein
MGTIETLYTNACTRFGTVSAFPEGCLHNDRCQFYGTIGSAAMRWSWVQLSSQEERMKPPRVPSLLSEDRHREASITIDIPYR